MTAARRCVLALVTVAMLGPSPSDLARADSAKIWGAPRVYFRKGPGPQHKPVGILYEGDEVETLDAAGEWTKVRSQAGEEGYVFGTFVIPVADPEPTLAEPPATAVPFDALADPATAAAPTAPSPPNDALVDEVVRLRAEVDTLKSRVEQEIAPEPTGAVPLPNGAPGPVPTPEAGTAQGESHLRTALAAGIAGLVAGWVLGALFSRRRSRAQRSRLRF